ncbi:phage tail-collar fiber domain-containing protein [Providencia sp. PROV_01]
MASVITTAFENWKAQEAASGKAVLLDEFVFANVPNLDPTKPIDRNEKLPPANQIVHRQAVNKAGLASENAVAYSVTMGTEVGNFDFNWIGLLNKASGTVAMITHAPTQKKLKTQNGQQGNVLTRSFLLEFQGAAKETQITTTAETWQIDFTARLSGIDEMQRLINIDSYGAAAFFNDGFEVTRSGEQFTVKKGLGYVGGLRGELAQNQILNGLRNTKIYADFSYQGNIISKWNTVVKITSAPTLNNYVDAAGFMHQVFAIASIDASGSVKDLRPIGALSDQDINLLNQEVNKKFNGVLSSATVPHPSGKYSGAMESTGELYKKMKGIRVKSNHDDSAILLAVGDNGAIFTAVYGSNGNFIKSGWLLDYDSAISKQEVEVLLGKKFDKNQIKNEFGEDIESVVSQDFITRMMKEKASNNELNIGLASKFNAAKEFNNVPPSEFSGAINVNNDLYKKMKGIRVKSSTSDAAILLSVGSDGAIFTAVYDENGKYLKSGWMPAPEDTLSVNHLANDVGSSTQKIMNQKAVTDAINAVCPIGSSILWNTSAPIPSNFWANEGRSFSEIEYPEAAKIFPDLKLPDDRGYAIRVADNGRGIDAGRKVATYQEDALQKFTGKVDLIGQSLSGGAGEGVLKMGEQKAASAEGGRVSFAPRDLTFDVSLVARTANETRMKNVAKILITRMK